MKIYIPIKQHSQRVPNKNFRLFSGEPLWVRTIQKFKGLCDIFIDTDSDEIIKQSELFGINAYMRPIHLRGDDVPVNSLIQNFVDSYCSDDLEVLAQIHVTTPFLTPATLMNACTKIKDYYDSAVACDIVKKRLWRPEDRNKKTHFIPVNHNPLYLEQTQDLTPLYMENSAFYIFTSNSFRKTNNRIGHNPLFVPVGTKESMDIDTEEDWEECLKIN